MHMSYRDLHRLAADVDDLHHEQMKTFQEEAADLHLDAVRTARRTSLAVPAAIGTAAALVALPFMSSRVAAQGLDDQTIAGYAQGVELAAVAAYKAAAPVLSRRHAPRRPAVHVAPPAARRRVRRRRRGQEGHRPEPQADRRARTPTLAGIKDEMAALDFAFVLEGQAAYTYAAALTLLQDPAYAAATSTILPIEAQHQVVLGLALGKSVTDVFPTGAFESAKLGDGTDPLAGLDPAVFAG